MKVRLMVAVACLVAAGAVLAAVAGGAGESKKTLFAVLAGSKGIGNDGQLNAGDRDGFGSFAGSVKGGKLCFALTAQNIAKPAAAHVHRGKRGVGGPIVVPLKPPSSGNGAASGCASASTALLSEINKSPSGFYVNVHTSDFPTGAIRGQLFHASSTQDR